MDLKLSPRLLLALMSAMNLLIYMDRGTNKICSHIYLIFSSFQEKALSTLRLSIQHFIQYFAGAIGSNGVNGSVATDEGPGTGIQVSDLPCHACENTQ